MEDMEGNSDKIIKIVFGWMILVLISYCIAPFFSWLYERVLLVKDNMKINIEVIEKGELWLGNIPVDTYVLEDILNRGGYKGKLEYRAAEEYGYACDFLVSYGDNADTIISIFVNSLVDTQLHFYTVGEQGGIFRVTADGFEQTIDTTLTFGKFIDVSPFGRVERNVDFIGRILGYTCGIITICVVAIFTKRRKIVFLKETQNGRIEGIDVIRLLAIMFVIMVHTLIAVGYYEQPMKGKLMFVLTSFRSCLICCVPIFMTLTGYLQKNKKFELVYYKRIFTVFLSYIIICLFYELNELVVGRIVTWKSIVDEILLFEHAWYVNMYIGIFVLTPFLNIIWKEMKTLKNRKILIMVFVLITSICTVTNNYITNYWAAIYPIMYYFIGCFLATYRIQIGKWINILLIFLLAIMQSAHIYFGGYGKEFNWNTFGGYNCSYNAFPTVVMVVLFFTFIERIRINCK